jgi:hypothetical protein
MSKEETDFLDTLLLEMGASLVDGRVEKPLPPSATAKHANNIHNAPRKKSHVTYKSPSKDAKDLLDGAEEWDWDDGLDDGAEASKTSVRNARYWI